MKITFASALFLALLNSGCNSPTMITIGQCNHAANGGNVSEPNGSQPAPCNVTIMNTGAGTLVGLTKTASLKNAAGEKVGTAALADLGEGVVIATDLHGLSSGKYSISLHSVGGCDLVLPSNRTRQLAIEIDGDKGFGTTIKGTTLDNGTNGLLGAGGGTIVINDSAGTRVACGVVK